MNAVDAPLFDAVGTLFLAEAGGVRGQGLGQLFRRDDLVNEPADHGVLGGADQVRILALDLVHHGVHIGLGHDALHHVAVDHEGGNAVGKALADHEVAGVSQHCFVQPRDIAQQVVEDVYKRQPQNWPMMVATAAPATPMSSTKINTGYSTMLTIAPRP